MQNRSLIPIEIIERKIYLIRGMKVMLDRDLAALYGVPTFRLNEAVKRNKERFPADFMFQLSKHEATSLTSHIAISNGRGGRRTSPYAFTEQGVAMLSSVLKSEKAIKLNILIIRAFVKLREIFATHKDLIIEIEKLRRNQKEQGKDIILIMNFINKLINPPVKENKEPMGFRYRDKNKNK